MANKPRDESIAGKIREAFDEFGWDTKPIFILQHLRNLGINATPQQVSNEKVKHKARFQTNYNGEVPLTTIHKVRQFIDELGSLELLKQTIAEIEKLQL